MPLRMSSSELQQVTGSDSTPLKARALSSVTGHDTNNVAAMDCVEPFGTTIAHNIRTFLHETRL